MQTKTFGSRRPESGSGAEEAAPAASCHRACYFSAGVLGSQLKSAAVAEPIHDTAHTSEAKGTIGPSVRALTHVCTHTSTHTRLCLYRWAQNGAVGEVYAAACVRLVIEKARNGSECVRRVLDSVLGTHTTVTRAVQRAAEFLLIKISIMETGEECRGAKVVQLRLGTRRPICQKASKAAFPSERESPRFSQKFERNRNVKLAPKPIQQKCAGKTK